MSSDATAAAAGASATQQQQQDAAKTKKKRDHDVYPDEDTPFPLGKVQRIKGAIDQVHAFKVFGTKYVVLIAGEWLACYII